MSDDEFYQRQIDDAFAFIRAAPWLARCFAWEPTSDQLRARVARGGRKGRSAARRLARRERGGRPRIRFLGFRP